MCTLGTTSPTIEQSAVTEASGLAQSAIHPGAYYVMNDSGDSARFFAMNADGGDLGEYVLEGVVNNDFEDMTMGPCATGICLFVGDTGDNDRIRPFATIHRLSEPATLTPGVHTVTPTPFHLEYPDGPQNVESLIIHPLTEQRLVLTREPTGTASKLFTFMGDMAGNIEQAVEVGSLLPPQGDTTITSADVHPSGYGVLVRTFSQVWFFPASGPTERLEETLSGTPCPVPTPVEAQGEAISWRQDGTGYTTVSEGPNQNLHHVECSSR